MFNVYFNEYNLLMGSGGTSYLPFVSGILSANAKKIQKLKKNFNFKPFIFKPESSDDIISKYYDDKPHIAVFSISMWNEQLSLKVAKKIKKKYNSLIIFGGPSCPHNPTEYFKKYDFIDIAVRAEGEDAFNDILQKYLINESFYNIPNVAFRDSDNNCIINLEKYNFNKNLDIYPSPYLSGEFDYLFKNKKDHNYQIIIETNRGCPFLCTYCYWGKGGTTTKYRFHSLDRVFAEIDWIAKKKIKYVFNADSNFGMHKRDIQIAEKLVKSKIETGYPDKFRTCWGKNTSEQIFKIASILNLYDLEKGITLARQTNSKQALLNVKRDNIKLESYSELEKKFNQFQIPVYAEMILGLPGETNESWVEGLCSLIDTSINNQIFIYQAEIYPNTELNELDYRKKHGIISTLIKLNEIHCSPRDQEWLQEYQEIVTQTSTMTEEDWKKRNLFSIILILIHSFKLGFYYLTFFSKTLNISSKFLLNGIIKYSSENLTPFIYKNIVSKINNWSENILKGDGRGVLYKEYSDVYLDIEEYIFINISKNYDKFYSEFDLILKKVLGKKYLENEKILKEIKKYQILRMPTIDAGNRTVDFEYNIAEYMFSSLSGKAPKIKKKFNSIKSINCKDYSNNLHLFTKEKIIWARKSDKIKNDLDYDNKMLKKIKKNHSKNDQVIDSDNDFNKPKMFESVNKFEKYSAINLKNNRRI